MPAVGWLWPSVNYGDGGNNDGCDAYTRCLGRSQSDIGRQSVGKLEGTVLINTVATVPRKNNAKDMEVGWGTDHVSGVMMIMMVIVVGLEKWLIEYLVAVVAHIARTKQI